MKFEYKVVPAPKKGKRAKGVRGGEARFANTLEELMNDLGAEGWEYQRSDTLPVENRAGLTGKSTEFQNMLVFRRTLSAAQTSGVQDSDAQAASKVVAAAVAVEQIAKIHAPALPSADAAQSLPESLTTLDASDADTKEVAAE